ncbi:MAG: Ni/Fe hydrogenase subunit alpha [Anaerolineales bacterium]|nr:Ni/Fe hydrogenase subunit alpha [Anaerolineales bacterium]
MTERIVIDPVTRIEGHSKITIQLDETGNVADARFHVTQYRGFERFCVGRPFYEMPGLMGRICGICTISHMLASAQACESIMSVRVMGTAQMLRKIVNYASLLQSHALAFFHLASPDFLLGMESDPDQRNLFGIMASNPEIARDGIRLRGIGQGIIQILANKKIHPDWIVVGGVTSPMTEEQRISILEMLPEAETIIRRTLGWFKRTLDDYREEVSIFGNFPTSFLALVNEHEEVLELYRGRLRMVDDHLHQIADFHRDEYQDYIGEAVEPWSYLKFPYYKPEGYPDGIYRVGPLARLNVIESTGTPKADVELAEFRERNHHSSMNYHLARLIECLNAVESIQKLVEDPEILNPRVRAHATANAESGIGVTEAPRGTLIHHYEVDENGLMTGANLIVSTTHNNLAMNRGVVQTARRYVDGNKLTEGMLNRVEAVIRAFDPCLSCSTHAYKQMALHFEMRSPDDELLDEVLRG